jgi:integrase
VPAKQKHLFDKNWVSLGRTKRDAYIAFANLPINTCSNKDNVRTVAELIPIYESEVLPLNSAGTRDNKLSYMPSIKAAMGHMQLCEIRKSHAKQLHKALVPIRGSKTAKEVIGLLRHMLTLAEEEGMVEKNRLLGMQIKGNPPRDRLVTYEEIDLFIEDFASSVLKVYIPLKLLTGLDKQSLLSLTIHDLSKEGLSAIRRKNSSKPKLYPWDEQGQLRRVIDDIEAYKRKQSVRSIYMFSNRTGQPYLPLVNGLMFDKEGHALGKPEGFNSIWNRSMSKWVEAGHERFTEHDLRKTPASATTTSHAQELLDHYSPEITKRVYQVAKNVVPIQPHPKDGNEKNN